MNAQSAPGRALPSGPLSTPPPSPVLTALPAPLPARLACGASCTWPLPGGLRCRAPNQGHRQASSQAHSQAHSQAPNRFLPLLLISVAGMVLSLLLGGCLELLPQDQGSPGAPVRLVVAVPHGGEVGAHGSSYYFFVPSQRLTHTIAATQATSDLGWALYTGADFLTGLVRTCNAATGRGDAVCSTPLPLNAGTTYYLRVDDLGWQGTYFQLRVSTP